MDYSPWGHKESDTTKQISLLVAQMVKNLPAMQETWVQSLGGEDPLEKGIATHFSILVWRISSMDRGQATVHGVTQSRTQLNTTCCC